MKFIKLMFVAALMSPILMACSGSDSMNKIVQNGGTILLSLGAYEELGHANISKTSITAKMIDSVGAQTSVTVREVFPLSVDRSSALNHFVTDKADGYSGFWFAAIDLIDKSTGLPTTFANGNANLQIKGLATVQNRTIKILKGNGTINPIMTFDGINTLGMLLPATQVKYLASDTENAFNEHNLLGALEIHFEYPTVNVNGLAPSKWPRVVSASNDENLQIQSYTRSKDGTNTLYVVVMNPAGIGQIAEELVDTPPLYQTSTVDDIRFGVVYPPQVSASAFANPSSRMGFDVDGAEVNIDSLVLMRP